MRHPFAVYKWRAKPKLHLARHVTARHDTLSKPVNFGTGSLDVLSRVSHNTQQMGRSLISVNV